MSPVAPARLKLYPHQDPRIAYAPILPVATALPSQTTAVITVMCPERDRFIVSTAASGGAPSANAILDPDVADEPPFQLHVFRPVLARSSFIADVADQSGIVLFTIRALPVGRRSPAIYHIYDESTASSTKGMPKRLPVYTVVDRTGTHHSPIPASSNTAPAQSSPPTILDAIVSKGDKPILNICVDQMLSPDAAWVMRDTKSDRTFVSLYDFVLDQTMPPSVTLKIEPPYCNQVALVLSLWAITYDLYLKRVAIKQRRR